MKVIADIHKCQPHGRRYDLAPNVFDADDDGRVMLFTSGNLSPDLEARCDDRGGQLPRARHRTI
jgi:ferredoxin